MNFYDLVRLARERGCSDIHLTQGAPVLFRIDGSLQNANIDVQESEVRQLILGMMNEAQREGLAQGQDQDFAVELDNGERQRVNVYAHKDGIAAAIRLLNNHIPSLQELGLPAVITTLLENPRGMILVTGPTGSGKSTTLAAMIDHLSKTRKGHILTVEDPIEYVFPQGNSLVHQRELGRDVSSFAAALRSALREDPDVILVGEMRDFETISTAVTAAETGHLVLSTLHTTGAAETIDRIVDSCPPNGQQQMRTQLSNVLKGVVTQQLVPLVGGGRVAATEVMVSTDAVGNLIRENKGHQLNSIMQSTGMQTGMHTLSSSLAMLAQMGRISRETAFMYATNPNDLKQYLR